MKEVKITKGDTTYSFDLSESQVRHSWEVFMETGILTFPTNGGSISFGKKVVEECVIEVKTNYKKELNNLREEIKKTL